jgi:hypothetical protein
MEIDPERIEWWTCTIGPVKRKQIGWGADFPLRQAIKEEFEKMFDTAEYEISSGWGLTAETNEVLGLIRSLQTNDPSGETLAQIYKLLKSQDHTQVKRRPEDDPLRLAKELGLETYNEKEEYFCIKGFNGQATLVYYGVQALAKVRDHLLQMGRDQLKIELNDLLDITRHH